MDAAAAAATQIRKPRLDDREYRHIYLPNGMEVIVVHDADADKAAASMDVGVGSFADPDALPGLAHFLEHLLFMGTERYPSENEYAQYVSDHGGMFNAYTASEHTNYHFEVAAPHLRGVLERFSQFFIAPLFLASAQEREVLAVDSENKKNLQSDTWRFLQLQRHLSSSHHPYHKFSTGNYETLGRGPASLGIDVRKKLIQFYREHYTASIMKLVLVGREPVATLESWARELFGTVPDPHPEKASVAPSYADLGKDLFKDTTGYEHVVVRTRPVMDLNLLELTFPVPDQQPLFKSQPYQYFTHLIGHEGAGSLLAFLREEQWATELSTVISHVAMGVDFFIVSIELTTAGFEHWKNVVRALFTYIDMVRAGGAHEWIFSEIRSMAALGFEFRQKTRPLGYASWLSHAMQRPVPRDRLLDHSIPTEFDAQAIIEFGSHLARDNCRAVLASQELEGLSSVEPWYGTEYTTENLGSIEPLPSGKFKLPEPNIFLPENFDLVSDAEEVAAATGADMKLSVPQPRPRLVIDTPDLRLWHKLDDQFKMPKALYYLRLATGSASDTVEHFVLMDIFAALVLDALVTTTYYADMGGIAHSLSPVSDGIEVEVRGFSEKLPKLLEIIIRALMEDKLAAGRFSVIKEQQLRNMNNMLMAPPYLQRAVHTNFLLAEDVYPMIERVNALEKITFADLESFVHDLRSSGAGVDMLTVGNVATAHAKAIAKCMRGLVPLRTEPVPPRLTSYVLGKGQHVYFETLARDPENTNSFVEVGFEFGRRDDVHRSALASMLQQVLREPTFNQLRTREQLGYVVGAYKRTLRNSLWLRFFVQSEEPTPFLEQRIEAFLAGDARKQLAELSEEEFKQHQAAVIAQLTEKPKNLAEEAEHYWSAIVSGFYDFSRRAELAEEVPKLERSDLLSSFEELVLRPATRSRFALHIMSRTLPEPDREFAAARAIGTLVMQRRVPVSPAQIQAYSRDCRNLSVDDALALLVTHLVEHCGLALPAAQELASDAAKLSDEYIRAGPKRRRMPRIGERAVVLSKFHDSVSLAPRPAPSAPLSELAGYKLEKRGQ